MPCERHIQAYLKNGFDVHTTMSFFDINSMAQGLRQSSVQKKGDVSNPMSFERCLASAA